MSSKEKPILPCCLVTEHYQEVQVDGHLEVHCGTCGKLVVEIHGKTAKISRHVTAMIEAREGYGPTSNPARMKTLKPLKPYMLKRWKMGLAPNYHWFFTCSRPGRTGNPASK